MYNKGKFKSQFNICFENYHQYFALFRRIKVIELTNRIAQLCTAFDYISSVLKFVLHKRENNEKRNIKINRASLMNSFVNKTTLYNLYSL